MLELSLSVASDSRSPDKTDACRNDRSDSRIAATVCARVQGIPGRNGSAGITNQLF